MQISQGKHLVGNFNSHLRDCCFLFADEAFFAGDKQHVSVLKALITEPTLTIEAKYQNAVSSPNYIHLFMASNDEWVVPAAIDARRFFVLEAAPDRANDHEYFGAIQTELENGGYEAMLYDLLNRDMRGFNVRAFPDTAALQDQKRYSLMPHFKWWQDVLVRGYVYQSTMGLEEKFSRWMTIVTTELLYKSYLKYVRDHNPRAELDRRDFGKFMSKLAKGTQLATGIEGETYDRTGKGALPVVNKRRPYGYRLGPLPEARSKFDALTGVQGGWLAAEESHEVANEEEKLERGEAGAGEPLDDDLPF